MEDFSSVFEARLEEIESYLNLLEMLENQLQEGVPRFAESDQRITPLQQKIMYSSVYIQLYSLVESTITQCIDRILDLIKTQELKPSELSSEFQREWVRFVARTHTDLNYEKRLDSALSLCNHLVQLIPIQDFEIDLGGGGNWDDEAIFKFSKRIGLQLEITPSTQTAIKRKIKDDLGALSLIKEYRNKLAHGNLSFSECGEFTTVADLRELTDKVVQYMREIIASFQSFVDGNSFREIDILQ